MLNLETGGLQQQMTTLGNSFKLKTGNWGYNSHKPNNTRTEKRCLVWWISILKYGMEPYLPPSEVHEYCYSSFPLFYGHNVPNFWWNDVPCHKGKIFSFWCLVHSHMFIVNPMFFRVMGVSSNRVMLSFQCSNILLNIFQEQRKIWT